MRIPWARKANEPRTVTLMVTGNADDPYTLMIEPWGMTYELAGADRIYVDVVVPEGDSPELVAWPGGLSIYVCGRAVTRRATGEVLHEF